MAEGRPVAWTIAGSDASGGAGIQADLATFADFGVHGCALVTALTTQTRRGVVQMLPTPAAHLAREMELLARDYPPGAVKVGMLAGAETVEAVARGLAALEVPVVLDPVLAASRGGRLLDDAGLRALEAILPQLALVTPNCQEAGRLAGMAEVADFAAMEEAAERIRARGARAVLVTGGHLGEDFACDYLLAEEGAYWLRSPRIATPHDHGTGCTLSAAVAAALARGERLLDAVVLAKMAVSAGLAAAVPLAGGPGAVAHGVGPWGIAHLPELLRERPDRFRAPQFPRCEVERLGLYPVVDSPEWVERVLEGGVRTVQLRIKDAPPTALEAAVRRAADAARRRGARLFVNDHWRLAINAGAYGVHLGQEDLDGADLAAIARAGLRLGTSNHAWYEIARSHALAPSYMALGPVYPTTTKEMRFAPLGVERLREWVELLAPRYPLVAIGGIDEARLPGVLATGVGSVAVVRAVTQAPDWRGALERLCRPFAVFEEAAC